MKIKELNNHDKLRFNELALSHGTIFNTIEWTNIFKDYIRRYGIHNKNGELIGGFIIYEQKRLGLTIYINPPFTPTIGPFLKIEAIKSVSIMDTWKKALSSMAEFLKELPFSVISVCLDKYVIDTQPFIWNKFKVVPGYTYIFDLTKSEKEIWDGFSAGHKNHVKKAIKDGLIVRQIQDFNLVKKLIVMTYSRQGEAVNEEYLNKILFEFANSNNCYAFATFNKDIPISSAFFIYDRNTSYLLASGYNNEQKHHGAGILSKWEGIKHAKKLGLKYFDFEGSMIPQIEIFNRGFGAQLTPYYRINKAKLPLEVLLKCYKREFF